MIEPYYQDDTVRLYLGDSLDVLPTLPDASVDAIVCDPPYGLADHHPRIIAAALATWLGGDRAHVPDGKGFMGREWDRFVPPPAVWDECLRVLKPGGHLVAFAGSRTADLMGLSIRLAGFEIRDSLHWIYGSGMPKSLDVSKAIDKAAGAEREVIGVSPFASRKPRGTWTGEVYGDEPGHRQGPSITAPATEDAKRWQGWGTALKPAHEPIVLARKPLAGTVAGTVLAHGTGALNIDGCRTAAGQDYRDKCASGVGLASNRNGDAYGEWTGTRTDSAHDAGRWPTNVVLSHPPLLDERGQPVGDACADGCVPGCPVADMDRQSGHLKSGGAYSGNEPSPASGRTGIYGHRARIAQNKPRDEGGASRFFPVFRYEAKAPASERPRLADGTAWPTVKPLALMRWLIRLVTPPGGTVLDWCAGTGTTLEAARLEDVPAIGIERDPVAAQLCTVRLDKPYMTGLFGEAS